MIHAADLFHRYGDYGVLEWSKEDIDFHLGAKGFADCLIELGWLRINSGSSTLHYFTDVSASRKTLSSKVRSQILEGASCGVCGSGYDLVIDHIVPIARGGSCDSENLQPLCSSCNYEKGTRTMSEFLAGETV